MARVTVEDCIELVPNRFDLVLFAAQRAREIARGNALKVDRDNDKNPVVALREIAENTLSLEALTQGIVFGLQKVSEPEEAEEEVLEALSEEQNWAQSSESEEKMEAILGAGFSFEDEVETTDA